MRTAEDFIKEMEGSNCLINREVTFNEYATELCGFQNAVCKMVAGDAYHEHMRLEEATFIMESKARQNHIRNHPTVNNGILTMKKLEKEIAITMSGAKGEHIVSRTLEYLNRPNTKVYRNVYITDGQEETELDGIVLTDSGIIILEVKKVKNDLTLTENGRMVFAGDECYDKTPLGQKMAIKRRLLRGALEQSLKSTGLDIPVYIDSYIVFSAPKGQHIQIDDRYHKEKYCFRTSLNKKIENYLGCAYYKEEHLEQFDKIFSEMQSNVKRFETTLNYDEVRRSLAEAMVVIQNTVEEHTTVCATNHKAKVIDTKVFQRRVAEKHKKASGLDYIIAGTVASIIGVGMLLGMRRVRA